ncbi:hypothetical protein ABZ714_00305 [Streptomyces sp. NPDC006798]|uniref:hypothetical protein n=1 Tax=Streptomyces sp. NPDC006798 TaxID=3155462 RepID=UPI0033F30B02
MTGPETDRPGHPAPDTAHRWRPLLLVSETFVRTIPVTPAEADAWITTLLTRGHLHHAERGPDGSWTVRRTADSRPWTLHHPALALDYAAEILLELRRTAPEAPR